MAEQEQDEPTIAQDAVVTKYKMAGEIVNKTLVALVAKCAAGVSVLELCEFGDNMLLDETSKVYRAKKDVKKGIAFPTCVSVNNCICHFSPLRSETPIVLKDGDLVKLDLGAHIDGYIAVVAHSLVVGASVTNMVKGRQSDVMRAAHYCMEGALRCIKPGLSNSGVTEQVQKIAEEFECKPVEGMLSHQLKRFRIDGDKSIIQNPTDAQRKEHEKCEFALHEVYAMDVIVTTGEGKGREMDARTTVFKRTDETYLLKMKCARMFLSEAEKKFGNMPFTLRAFEDESKARLGVVECVSHKLLDPFQVLYEKEGEFVAQFKVTVLVMPNGLHRLTTLPFEYDMYQVVHEITNTDILKFLSVSTSSKSKKKKKKTRSAPGAIGGGKGDGDNQPDDTKTEE